MAQSKSGRSSRQASYGGRGASRRIRAKVVERASDVKEGVGEMAESVKGELAEDWKSANERARDATQSVQKDAERLAGKARRSLERAGSRVAGFVKDNPLPLAMLGAGLTWLAVDLIAGGGRAERSEAPRRGDGGAADRLGDATRRVKQSTRKILHDVGARGERIERTLEDTIRENPAAFGAGALALGAATGFVLPRTRLEDEWLGEQRDEVVQKAEQAARGAVDKVESAAKKLVGVARETTSALHH